jgi:hypothetical protein
MLTEDEIGIPQEESERFVPEPQHITTEDSYEAINFTV